MHARALYRPVPPVDCDDDGYPFKDSARVESTRHFDARAHLVHVVRVRYAERKDVFAAADMGLYFERGNRRALVVPDGMVVFGIDNHPDLSYKLWEHLKAPDLVLEVLSKYTWRKDVYDKPALYHDLGVREYWLFDPKGRRRDGGGALEGWRRTPDGVWEAAATAGDGFVSEVLGLELLACNAELRFRELGARDVLPDAVETSRRWEQESARADQESARADQESARADEESARADQEAARADAAQRRIAELEARLRGAERD
ncbi:MAG: Uma2 family endonuclease [Gammaproteobacteria bacterium]|nr:Uma2 family endonuclease [Gammaproteobacteria bacterium]